MENDRLGKLCELLKGFSTAMLVTHSEKGGLRARPMALVEVESSCRLWFITSQESAKVHEIEKDRDVMVICQDGEKVHVSLSGRAHLERDQARVDRVWRESFKAWFPRGKTDLEIIFIAVSPLDAEYWDNRGTHGVKFFTKSLKGNRPDRREDEGHGRIVLMP